MDFTDFNYLDYSVIVVIFLSMFFAFIRGFIGSFLSLTGWVLSIYLAYTLFPEIKPILEEKISNPFIVMLLGHAGLLISFLIGFGIINLLAITAVKGLTSGLLDRILGAGFGVIRGAVIISFVFLLFTTGINIFHGKEQNKTINDDTLPTWVTAAKAYPYIVEGSLILTSFIPQSFYERFQSISDEVTKKTMDDRFIDNAIQKFKKSLSNEDIKAIENRLNNDENFYNQSSEEIKYGKLQELLKSYDQNRNNSKANSSNFSKEDLDKLRKILKVKQGEFHDMKSKAHVLEDSVESIGEVEIDD